MGAKGQTAFKSWGGATAEEGAECPWQPRDVRYHAGWRGQTGIKIGGEIQVLCVDQVSLSFLHAMPVQNCLWPCHLARQNLKRGQGIAKEMPWICCWELRQLVWVHVRVSAVESSLPQVGTVTPPPKGSPLLAHPEGEPACQQAPSTRKMFLLEFQLPCSFLFCFLPCS